jgi:hypothetical protein
MQHARSLATSIRQGRDGARTLNKSKADKDSALSRPVKKGSVEGPFLLKKRL